MEDARVVSICLRSTQNFGELRWNTCGRQHRLVGYFEDGVFVALMGCVHKMNIYDPHDAIETAEKRLGQINRKEATTCEYKL